MASTDPTPKRDGKGMTCWVEDASNSQVNVEADYGIRAFFKVHCDGLAAPGWFAIIVSTASPQGNSTYNSMPIMSVVLQTDGQGIYMKDAAGDNWGKLTPTT